MVQATVGPATNTRELTGHSGCRKAVFVRRDFCLFRRYFCFFVELDRMFVELDGIFVDLDGIFVDLDGMFVDVELNKKNCGTQRICRRPHLAIIVVESSMSFSLGQATLNLNKQGQPITT